MSDEEIIIPKLTNKHILIICGSLLIFIFVYGLNLSYELGFYTGGSSVCSPLSLGIDDYGEYMCFNESLQQPSKFGESNFNVDLEALNWS